MCTRKEFNVCELIFGVGSVDSEITLRVQTILHIFYIIINVISINKKVKSDAEKLAFM